MKKVYLLTVLVYSFVVTCQAQESNQGKVEKLKPPFENQGQQEDYWAQEFFNKHYIKVDYKKYPDSIKVSDNNVYVYGEKQFKVITSNNNFKSIFMLGLLYPQLIYGNINSAIKTASKIEALTVNEQFFYKLNKGENLTISEIEELSFLNPNNNVKRFRFWLSTQHMANPTVYLFELTNENVKEPSSLQDFISGSKLTFFKSGWLIL
ncbi:hypothetical protein AAU57_03145 [Nonlabens sp. YIK11]|uniref:hypothetical protein n=1 Tax=Nonlabens sp. YIK11 TaxID=1453349 RepID=UPI0006DC5943|nr:hypothetical protein [Nonlabens sp. YIK11]KQC32436.1 hypothetical protein AAU57_03145 [Nonlabens sp. YIK11]